MSAKHPSETNNKLENIVVNILPILGSECFLSNLIDNNRIIILGNENSVMNLSDVAVNFNDVIRIAYCALNIESTQTVTHHSNILMAIKSNTK